MHFLDLLLEKFGILNRGEFARSETGEPGSLDR